MTLFTKGFTNDLVIKSGRLQNLLDATGQKCLTWNRVLSRYETWSSRRSHTNFFRAKTRKKNHVNENLEKTPNYVILTKRTHQC